MASVKVTVTLPDSQLRQIRALVDDGRASSVSGFVQRSVQTSLDETVAWARMLSDALAETGGPLSDAERAWADSVLAPSAPQASTTEASPGAAG